MLNINVAAEADGVEDRTFKCGKCGHVEVKRMAADPLTSPVLAWIKGELKPPE
jgi:hypothetical protein